MLDRSGKSIRPTDAGEIYLRHARRAFDELEVAERAVRDVEDLSIGALRMGITPTFAPYLVGPLVRRYRDRYPAIALSVVEIAQREMEVALGPATSIWVSPSAAFRRKTSSGRRCTPNVSCLSSAAVTQTPEPGRSIGPSTLASQSFALLDRSFVTRVLVDQYFDCRSVRPHVAVEANSISVIVEIVRNTGLATVLPEQVAQAQSDLSPLHLVPALDRRRVALLRRRGGYRSAAARAFVDVVEEYVRELGDQEPGRGAPTLV